MLSGATHSGPGLAIRIVGEIAGATQNSPRGRFDRAEEVKVTVCIGTFGRRSVFCFQSARLASWATIGLTRVFLLCALWEAWTE